MSRICVLRQHYVPRDTRVAREVAALTSAGHEVEVICLRDRGEPGVARDGSVRYWRLPLRHAQGHGRIRYVAEYATFFAFASGLVTGLHLRRRFALVQANSLPDVLVFAALVPRLTGARVLLDLQECMPEFFAAKFGTGPGHLAVRLVAALEQLSIRFAQLVITPTEQMLAVFASRGADPAKVSVVMDGADEGVFRPVDPDSRSAPPSGTFTLVSHGTVEEHYGLDTVIRAVELLREEIPGLRLAVYGDGSHLTELRRLTAQRGLEDRVFFSGGFVPMDELVRAIGAADVGVIALRRDAFRDVSLAGKMFDFVAMAKPMVVARTRSVEETFGPDCVELFESGDEHDLARAIRALYGDEPRRREMARRAAVRAAPMQWSRQRTIYLGVVQRLLTDRDRRSALVP